MIFESPPIPGTLSIRCSIADSGGNELARLVPLADVTYYVRDRTYSPRHGRWLQQDPNATGMVVIALLARGGVPFLSGADAMSLSALLVNGPHLFHYLGANPHTRADPLGLQWEDDLLEEAEEFLLDPTTYLTDWSGTGNPFGLAFDYRAASDGLGLMTAGLESMVSEYAGRQEADLDWAMDWGAGDDDLSRRSNEWVEVSFATGIAEHFGLNWMLEHAGGWEGTDGPAMAVKGKAGSGRSKLQGISRAMYKIRRAEFKQNRIRYWKVELQRNPSKYTDAQRQEVLKHRRAPTGSDGHPMEIHHVDLLSRGGKNEMSNFRFITRTEHRLGRNNRRNHPR